MPDWVRNDSVLASTRGPAASFFGSCPRTLLDDLATRCGRPAHDHWTISANSGQHTSQYQPVMIAPFLEIDRDGAPKKFAESVKAFRPSQKGHVAAASLSSGKPTLNHPQDRAAASLRWCGPIEPQHCNCGSELERHRARADTCICGMKALIGRCHHGPALDRAQVRCP